MSIYIIYCFVIHSIDAYIIQLFGLCLNFSANSLVVKLKGFRKEILFWFYLNDKYESFTHKFLLVKNIYPSSFKK